MLLEFMGFLRLTFADVLDIVLVAAIIFVAFRWLRGSSAMNIFIAIILVLLVRIVASALGMRMISSILGTILDVGAVGLIVIFQPEIRKFLNKVGSASSTIGQNGGFLSKILPQRTLGVDDKSVVEIADACSQMSAQKTGALIILRRANNLEDIISTGDTVDARISARLIMNIFFKNSPLHDGAMIIGGGRIIAARCTLPISDRTDLPASYGMRHKAAVGISEQSDADVIVVSEQTGRISFVRGGAVTPIDNINTLKTLLGGKTE